MPEPAHSPHPGPRWELPDRPSLEWLRHRAKRLRADYNEPSSPQYAEAHDLVAAYDPLDTGALPLARAQRVLARAFGFAGWSGLREHVTTRERLTRPMQAVDAADAPVARFLRLACLSYTEPSAAERARGMLADDPALATTDVFTMAVTGRAAALADALAADPSLVATEGGPHRWVPLLHLVYSRLGVGDPPGSLRALLAAGADPDAGFLWKGLPSPFTALTGVLGGGERDEPPHPDAVALAELLLGAGADPNDNQAFYNRMFSPDDSHLGPLLSHGAGRDRPSPWRRRLGTAYPTAEEMVGEHLRSAAEKGFTRRVRLLLEHGVDPNTTGYHPILGDQTAYEVAVRHGHREAAALLTAVGGHSDRLDEVDHLLAAAYAGDRGAVSRLWVSDLPTRRPDAMRLAGEQHGIAALALLLDLGYAVDAPGRHGTTALHESALRGEVETCRWLVERGADRSAQDSRFSSTPSGWAAHAGHAALAEELAPDAASG